MLSIAKSRYISGKKILIIIAVFGVLFFVLNDNCAAFVSPDELLQIAQLTEQNQLTVSDILKKATADKTTISSQPLKIENISTQKTLNLKNTFLGRWQREPLNYALTVRCLRATDDLIVFCPCHHYILELRL
ncbi:MAG: hypothetical protein AB1349_04040 [Elusimicrobiota bacterium]